MLSSSHGSASSTSSEINIKEFLFCIHGREVCSGQDVGGVDSKHSSLSHEPIDHRADNDCMAGFDEMEGRSGLEAAFKLNKDDQAVCLKHGTVQCDNCFNFKKALAKMEKDEKKKGRKGKK